MNSKLEPGNMVTWYLSADTLFWQVSIGYLDVQYQRGSLQTEGACLCQPISWSIAAILHDSVAVIVRTHPRAVPLAMITMRKSIHGFRFLSYMAMGLRLVVLWAAGAPLWKHVFEWGGSVKYQFVWCRISCSLKSYRKMKTGTCQNYSRTWQCDRIRKLQVASKKLPILSILRYSRVAIKKNIWFDFKALEGASNTSPELRRNWHYERVLSNLNRQSLLYFIPFCFYLCQNFCFGFRDAVKKCFTSCMA